VQTNRRITIKFNNYLSNKSISANLQATKLLILSKIRNLLYF